MLLFPLFICVSLNEIVQDLDGLIWSLSNRGLQIFREWNKVVSVKCKIKITCLESFEVKFIILVINFETPTFEPVLFISLELINLFIYYEREAYN